MEFNPRNNVVQLCVKGMSAEEMGKTEEAEAIFFQAWNEAANDFEKFLAAHFVARTQKNVTDRLRWQETALQFAIQTNDDAVKGAYRALYLNLAKSYEDLNDYQNAKRNYELANSSAGIIHENGPFYHGTRADLQIGDLLIAGNRSNYNPGVVMNHIYFTALINGAGLAATMAKGEGRERVYVVVPTGSFENDPNLTDKKFPGNLTRSYRTEAPLKIVGEVTDWQRQSPEELKKWKEKLANNKGEIINYSPYAKAMTLKLL